MTQPATLMLPATREQTQDVWITPPHSGTWGAETAETLADVRLTEGIKRALRETGYPALRAVEVAIRGRLVVIRGTVPTHYLKQVAQVTVLAAPGIDKLCNHLHVAPRRM